MNRLVDNIFAYLLTVFKKPWIVAAILAVLPLSETRLAIPAAIKYDISPLFAFLLGFVPSTVAAAVLLLILLPFIRFLADTKLFRRLGEALLNKFEGRAEKADGRSERRRMLSVGVFTSLPLPLTGVWTGSAVAGILSLKYFRAFLSVAAGNFVTSVIMTVASVFFPEYINIMVAVFSLTAVAAVIVLLAKTIFSPAKTGTKG